MKITVLPTPPNPDDNMFKNNPLAYQRAVYQWMQDSKGKLEQNSRQNDSPLNQAFVVSSYTLNTSLSGTSTGTDVANFICSLIAAMQKKGLITPT